MQLSKLVPYNCGNKRIKRQFSIYASTTINELPNSGIREIMSKAAHMEKNGGKVIHLEVGQPNFPSPTPAIDATIKALQDGKTTYVSNDGIIELKNEICLKYQRMGIATSANQVVVTTGSMLSMFSLFLAIIRSGDECLVPFPGFPNYYQTITMLKGQSIPYITTKESEFLPTVNQIAGLITPRTRCIVLCNPGNPTGALYDSNLLEGILQLAREKNIYVISDEIYGDISFDIKHTCAAKFESLCTLNGTVESNLAVVAGVSKSFSMTGFRIGWTRCSGSMAACLTKLQEPLVSSSTTFAQFGAVAALKDCSNHVSTMTLEYHKRRDAALRILESRRRKSSYIPQGAFYLPLDISCSKLNSYDFAIKLLLEKGVAVAPGSAFDTSCYQNPEFINEIVTRDKVLADKIYKDSILNSFVRVSLANNVENVCEGINRICDLLDELDRV